MKDWTGYKFGKLEVIRDSGRRQKSHHVYWECRCDCGKTTFVSTRHLIPDNVQSCGCSRKEPAPDLTGKQYGSITAIALDEKRNQRHKGHPYWICACDCGEQFSVGAHRLLFMGMTHCGCRSKKTLKQVMEQRWELMNQRCYDPNYFLFPSYGGRGIRVCKRWRFSFDNFYQDMGDPPRGMTIDRIDVNGHYSPENCRWATIKDQNNNKVDTIYIEFNGVKKSISQWEDTTGLPVRFRLNDGWEVEKALTIPEGFSRIGAHLPYEEVDF